MTRLVMSLVTLVSVAALALPASADGFYRPHGGVYYGYYGGGHVARRNHAAHHDDLEHRAYHRELDHRRAHRYPMTHWQHNALHDHLDHDAFHDRLEHRRAHATGAYYPYGYNNYYYYSTPYYSRGFSIYWGR
jgi:hypothetical protein